MALPLLQSKLYVPPLRSALVGRIRLLNRLNEGLSCKLTLVSAPAGFGKTTLVSEWVGRLEHSVAWLSLDEGDNDPTRFLMYLVAALQTIAPTLGAGVLAALHTPQPPPPTAVLTALLNELTTIPTKAVIILDDYHLIESQPIDQALTFLLEHLPPQMHLVIATRDDPPLPLARFRARRQLTEVRAADLRFTPAEAAVFLNQVMGLSLTAEEVASLEDRTEGWIAGLQLAAIAMQGRQDVQGFIQAFTGGHRYIVDYLVDEVLHRQPDALRRFLLQTAILERLCGPLCDAVMDQTDGVVRLEALERGNFFVVPLDEKRQWYRYHHLFADVLQAHLRAEQPERLPTLHRRASLWYEQQGSTAEAIRHALQACDFARAAALIEVAVPTMLKRRQEATLLGWLKALPDELIHVRPVLSVGYASTLLVSGVLDGVEARLQDAERWLATRSDSQAQRGAPVAEMVVVDHEAFRRLPGSIALYRAGQALALGKVSDTVTYARQVLDLAPGDDYLTRGGAAALLGLAAWNSGDLESAAQAYLDAMVSLQKVGSLSDAIGCALALADIRIAQGRLHEAMRTLERGLHLAAAGEPLLRGAADMYVGMSELHQERNELQAATDDLLRSKALGEHNGLPQNPYRWRVAMARIREVQGDLAGALDLLEEAERLYTGDFSPNVRPIPALKARVWVAQGRLAEAFDWARTQRLSAHDDLSYLREFEHITLARILLASYQRDQANHSLREAMSLLDRLLTAAEAGQRTGSVIEILLLQSLTYQRQGDLPAALNLLQRALTLVEPEGYVRIVVAEGPAMAQLLREAAARGIKPDVAGQMLAASSARPEPGPSQPSGPMPLASQPLIEPLIEPLSPRELEVLRLFNTELSGPEIAEELILALSTLRTHTKRIYSKLGVKSRRAAVKRASALGLI